MLNARLHRNLVDPAAALPATSKDAGDAIFPAARLRGLEGDSPMQDSAASELAAGSLLSPPPQAPEGRMRSGDDPPPA